nr:MAG TPA: head-tail joining protein [Caudoviricetes sp.]
MVSKSNRIEFKGKQYRIEDILEGSFDRDFTTLVCKQMED